MNLVTGASGLIGRALAASLLHDGAAVRLQGRSAQSVAMALYSMQVQANLEIVEMDLGSASQMSFDRLASGCSVVVHCAGLVHQSDAPAALYDSVNFRATQMLATAAKKARVETFVFLSTSAVYGNGPFENADENYPLDAQTPYAVSKLRCEQWLQANPPAPRLIILRPSLVFGPGDRGNMLSLIRQINKGIYFHVGGNKARKSVIYSSDAALAIQRCLRELSPGTHIINIANPSSITLEELGNEISHCLGRQLPPSVPQWLVRAGAMVGGAVLGEKSPLTVGRLNKIMTTTTCSVQRLVETTGFSPTLSVVKALQREIDWARTEELLPPVGGAGAIADIR